MLGESIKADVLQVKTYESDRTHMIEEAVSKWLKENSSAMIHDITFFSRGNLACVAIVYSM